MRKVKEGETTNDLFGFLTTEPNAEVGAVHPKAMPVILTSPRMRDLADGPLGGGNPAATSTAGRGPHGGRSRVTERRTYADDRRLWRKVKATLA